MSNTNTTINGDSTDAEIMLPESSLEEGVIEQIQTMIDHEAFDQEVAIMPDTHVGSGAVIGFTMPLGDRVVPNTIGVDIGCGMYAVNFGHIDYSDEELERLDQEIRERVPMGFNVHSDQNYHLGDDFPWPETTSKMGDFEMEYGNIVGDTSLDSIGYYNLEYFKNLCDRVGYDMTRAINSVGTLGGGNHFIEMGYSDDSGLWCIIHSGSRGIGLSIAQHHQERAAEIRGAEKFDKSQLPDGYEEYATEQLKPRADKIRENFEGTEIGQVFDTISQARQEATREFNDDLAYLEGEEAHQYYVDMIFAQMYASESRKRIMDSVIEVIGEPVQDEIESVHNFIDFEDLTIRKGATRAHEGERAVIPYNMRDGTIIVEGKGNGDWNRSAPHGAGRVMSRTQAFEEFDLEDFEWEMENIVSSSVNEETLDEAPMAYKDYSLIELAITPTATIVDRIKPVLNIKAE